MTRPAYADPQLWMPLLLAAALLGCSSDGVLAVQGVGSIDGASSVQVWAIPGVCADVSLAALEGTPLAVLRAAEGEALQGQLPNQMHAVAAFVFNGACDVVAFACTDAQPGRDVTLRVRAREPEDVGFSPANGQCQREGILPDAGLMDMQPDEARDAAAPDSAMDVGVNVCLSLSEPVVPGEDADGDGLSNGLECPSLDDGCCEDTDDDGVADYLDIDSDNDGAFDAQEGARAAGSEPFVCESGAPAYVDPACQICVAAGGALSQVDLTANPHCGVCGLDCEESTSEVQVPFCGPSLVAGAPGSTCRRESESDTLATVQLAVTANTGPGLMSTSTNFEMALVPIRRDAPFRASDLGGAPIVWVVSSVPSDDSGGPMSMERSVRISEAMVRDAIANVSAVRGEVCFPSLGSGAPDDCMYVFAIVVRSRAGTPTCHVFPNRFVVYTGRGADEYTFWSSLDSLRFEAEAGARLYSRRTATNPTLFAPVGRTTNLDVVRNSASGVGCDVELGPELVTEAVR